MAHMKSIKLFTLQQRYDRGGKLQRLYNDFHQFNPNTGFEFSFNNI